MWAFAQILPIWREGRVLGVGGKEYGGVKEEGERG
eukprot:SAG11_NODE_18436_length_491_cov_1.099490_1_plen_35_part_00